MRVNVEIQGGLGGGGGARTWVTGRMAAEGSDVGCPVGRKVPSTGAASRIPGYDATKSIKYG